MAIYSESLKRHLNDDEIADLVNSAIKAQIIEDAIERGDDAQSDAADVPDMSEIEKITKL